MRFKWVLFWLRTHLLRSRRSRILLPASFAFPFPHSSRADERYSLESDEQSQLHEASYRVLKIKLPATICKG